MDWVQPWFLLLIVPAIALLWWLDRDTLRPLPPFRRRSLIVVRALLIFLALLSLAGPAWERNTNEQAVIFIFDHSLSQGEEGYQKARERVAELVDDLPRGTHIGYLSAGKTPQVLLSPEPNGELPETEWETFKDAGGQTNLAAAVSLARGLFPAGASRRIVLITDGLETKGNLIAAAETASLEDVSIDVVPLAGPREPDVRVVKLDSSKSRAYEGASIELTAQIESSLVGKGVVRLFENEIEVEAREVEVKLGETLREKFIRTPEQRNMYTYRVRVENFEGDTIAENDEQMALVDVRGRPLLLYIEGEEGETKYLVNAMVKQGIRLHVRSPEAFPQSRQELFAYDGVIVSDVPAHKFSNESMQLVREYVEDFGGGFVMVGGRNSFGVGGYYRTPIEDVLPVKMEPPDKEEKYSTALALVIDRSGSMRGNKIEICKSAAIATVDLLSSKDYVGVVAFDSSARWIVPMTQVRSKSAIAGQIATLNSGGGTNIHPGMTEARQELLKVKAKVKHMIVLTDGQTNGTGYDALAAQLKSEGVTVSTVAVGTSVQQQLLQTIAAAGGGKFYQTNDPANLPRIFTQDAMVHMGKLIREEQFQPKGQGSAPMLKGIELGNAPPLLGYVKTTRKQRTQIPMVTDLDEPLLAHWQYGLGKVTAFTSDIKSRWGALWITSWPGYGQFWAQVLRETARKPQGVNMDIQIKTKDEVAKILIDLREDGVNFKNNAEVEADIYHVPQGGGSSRMELVKKLRLEQTGSGSYAGDFRPKDAGIYLVQARSGADMVSAGLVHQVSGEAATGQIETELLNEITSSTGGVMLADDVKELTLGTTGSTRIVELLPIIVRIFLVLFLLDVIIRRWENLVGMVTIFQKDA